jgi:hypothetical protein
MDGGSPHSQQIMDPETSFDLERALVGWRRQLTAEVDADGSRRAADKEAALLASFEELRKRGLEEDEAFALSVFRLGGESADLAEPPASKPVSPWPEMLFWMATAVLIVDAMRSAHGLAIRIGGLFFGTTPRLYWTADISRIVLELITIGGAWGLARGWWGEQVSKLTSTFQRKGRVIWYCLWLAAVNIAIDAFQMTLTTEFFNERARHSIAVMVPHFPIVADWLWTISIPVILFLIWRGTKQTVVGLAPTSTFFPLESDIGERDPASSGLEHAIADWLETMQAQIGVSADQSRELATHLADSTARLIQVGLSPRDAFWVARRRLGTTTEIAAEFAHSEPGVVWGQRAFWMVAGLGLQELATMSGRGVIPALGRLERFFWGKSDWTDDLACAGVLTSPLVWIVLAILGSWCWRLGCGFKSRIGPVRALFRGVSAAVVSVLLVATNASGARFLFNLRFLLRPEFWYEGRIDFLPMPTAHFVKCTYLNFGLRASWTVLVTGLILWLIQRDRRHDAVAGTLLAPP